MAVRERAKGLLSRGERKRVALFLTLAAERPVVVLDEPFSASDTASSWRSISAFVLVALEPFDDFTVTALAGPR